MGDSAKPIVVINRRHLPIYLGESEIEVGTGEGITCSKVSKCQIQNYHS